ncbi:MAG: rRNA maturation RNase YbeY, partial [Pyrinomonadaceae bacterium]
MASNYAEVINYQRKFSLDLEQWTRFTARAIKAVRSQTQDARTEVTIAFISDRRMRNLNQQYRGVNRTTDVLSFPVDPSIPLVVVNYLGDIAVSIERAERQARWAGISLDSEIAQLILHGLLHLYGFDHETDNGEMNRIELNLRR